MFFISETQTKESQHKKSEVEEMKRSNNNKDDNRKVVANVVMFGLSGQENDMSLQTMRIEVMLEEIITREGSTNQNDNVTRCENNIRYQLKKIVSGDVEEMKKVDGSETSLGKRKMQTIWNYLKRKLKYKR